LSVGVDAKPVVKISGVGIPMSRLSKDVVEGVVREAVYRSSPGGIEIAVRRRFEHDERVKQVVDHAVRVAIDAYRALGFRNIAVRDRNWIMYRYIRIDPIVVAKVVERPMPLGVALSTDWDLHQVDVYVDDGGVWRPALFKVVTSNRVKDHCRVTRYRLAVVRRGEVVAEGEAEVRECGTDRNTRLKLRFVKPARIAIHVHPENTLYIYSAEQPLNS
jgi:hypothetical protein